MTKEYIPTELRRIVQERGNYCCEYCRSQLCYAMSPFAIEHIVSRDKGGPTHLENLAFSCQGCNSHKYNKTEALDTLTQQLVALYHPRQQRWRDHFAWSQDGTIILGLTLTGRATVDTLQLNRPGVVNLRRVLVVLGEHPPPEPD